MWSDSQKKISDFFFLSNYDDVFVIAMKDVKWEKAWNQEWELAVG